MDWEKNYGYEEDSESSSEVRHLNNVAQHCFINLDVTHRSSLSPPKE